MREFKILTDNTAELPESYIQAHDLTLAWLFGAGTSPADAYRKRRKGGESR